MNIKEKLSLEKPDDDVIRLYHEGIFYVAYSYSAVRFKRQCFPGVCLLNQQKKDGSSYYRIGVVQNSEVLEDYSLKDEQNQWIPSLAIPYTSGPIEWSKVVPDKVIVSSRRRADLISGLNDSNNQRLSSGEMSVIKELKSLDLNTLNPVKSMKLLLDWSERLRLEGIE